MSSFQDFSESAWPKHQRVALLLSALSVFILASIAAAQPPLGAGNEVWVDVPDTVYVGQEVEIKVYMANSGTVQAFVSAFQIYSSDADEWDWVVQPPSEWDFMGEINIVSHVGGFRLWEYLPSRLGEWGPVDSQLAIFDVSAGTYYEPWGPPGPLEHAYTIHIRPTKTGTICIDSSDFWAADDMWIYFGSEGSSFPAWNGPFCMTVAEPPLGDVNCDGAGNLGDAVYIINWIFKGGPDPCR
jgi:hypothetical protein